VETNRTEIYIQQAPSFIIPNQQSSSIISVKQNQTISLITPHIKTGGPNPPTVIWYVKGKTLKLPFDSTMLRSQLSIDPTIQQDQIACVIENEFGGTAYFFRLDFLQKPRFILALRKRIEVNLGQDVNLTINVTGNPRPTIQWLHNERIIENQRFEQHVTIDSELQSLIIRKFTLIDVGNYKVVVKNSEDEISSETQLILKSGKTTIKRNMRR
jgi:hypothetical protein